MKESKYNFFFPYVNNNQLILAYNSFSNALAVMTDKNYDAFEKYLKGDQNALDKELKQKLEKGNFLINNNTDELMLIRHKMYQARYNTNALSLTLAPTSSCNFRCVYCYEKESLKDEVMSAKTQDAIIKLLEKQAPQISHFHVSWYGGEPLLALEIIESLTTRFLLLSQKYGFVYSADIVTNGYLLTSEVSKRIKQCNITRCQITLDGSAQTHNERRPLKSGKGTYKQIIKNLVAADSILPEIVLRVNIDENNADSIDEVTNTIRRLNLIHVKAYPAPIKATNGCYQNEVCFTRYSFQDFEYNYLIKQNDTTMIMSKYPTRRLNACCADYTNAFVINADGEMYKCWSDIGIKCYSIGNVSNGKRNLMNEILYLKDDPTQDRECCNCKFLPICLGGCPHERREKSEDRCVYKIELHRLYINRIAQILLEAKNCVHKPT